MARRFEPGDALLVVDVQHDLCAGGALLVPDADAIVPAINEWIAAARAAAVPIIAVRDWHPPDHASFTEQGGALPPHCIQNTPGAAFHAELRLPPDTVVVDVGTQPDVVPASGFDGTDLAPRLRDAGARRLWIAGLALDDAVRATALEALRRGLAVDVIASATRARATTHPADSGAVLEELQAAGAFVSGRHAPEIAER